MMIMTLIMIKMINMAIDCHDYMLCGVIVRHNLSADWWSWVWSRWPRWSRWWKEPVLLHYSHEHHDSTGWWWSAWSWSSRWGSWRTCTPAWSARAQWTPPPLASAVQFLHQYVHLFVIRISIRIRLLRIKLRIVFRIQFFESNIHICTCMSRSPTMKADPWQYPTCHISVVSKNINKNE